MATVLEAGKSFVSPRISFWASSIGERIKPHNVAPTPVRRIPTEAVATPANEQDLPNRLSFLISERDKNKSDSPKYTVFDAQIKGIQRGQVWRDAKKGFPIEELPIFARTDTMTSDDNTPEDGDKFRDRRTNKAIEKDEFPGFSRP